MKKVLAITAILFILSITTLITFSAVVNSNKDTVTITEKIYVGEKEIAEGISILSSTHYGNQLFWNTKYTVGENTQPETEYSFFNSAQTIENNTTYYYFEMNTDIRYGCDFNTPAEEQVGLSRIYKELYDKCKVGERIEETVYLKDVYEYYPIRLDINIPNIYWTGNDYENIYHDEYGQEKYVLDKFREFFRIPVFEEHKINIGIGRDANGISIHSGTAEGSEEYDFFFYSVSAHTDDTVFFTIRNKTSYGKYADFSLVPGGYGIYSFKYEYKDILHYTGIQVETLQNVYLLDVDFQVNHMEISDNGKYLIVIGIKNNDTILKVIEIKTMSLVREIVIEDRIAYNFKLLRNTASGDYYHVLENIKSENDFMIILFSEEFALIKPANDGNYTLEFIAPQMNYIDEKYNFMDYSSKMVFDGNRFIIVDSIYDDELQTELCGFYIAIYDETGLIYYAEYESSLDINSKPNNYSYNCNPTNTGYTIEINE